ncbi:MAG: hypothetical protein M1339_05850 [Bacteroidetes bacterium]|nr:hypothetical protein [Bacteroidota bacterium]
MEDVELLGRKYDLVQPVDIVISERVVSIILVIPKISLNVFSLDFPAAAFKMGFKPPAQTPSAEYFAVAENARESKILFVPVCDREAGSP